MDLRFRSVKRMFVMQPIKKHDYAVVGIRLLRAGAVPPTFSTASVRSGNTRAEQKNPLYPRKMG
jgi:hypothetical protein